MPRITPCRVIKFILFVYLVMIWLWFSLPSPTIPPLERAAHIQKTLASGKPLLTVHQWDKSFGLNESQAMREGNTLIIKWRFQHLEDDNLSLHIGNNRIGLGQFLSDAERLNFDSGVPWTPYFAEPLNSHDTPVGDVDSSVLCMPWFNEAEKHLITHEMHGTTGDMALRFIVTGPNTIELWKDGVVSHHLGKTHITAPEVPGLVVGKNPKHRKQEAWSKAWEGMKMVDRDFGMLVRFKYENRRGWQDVVVEDMQGDLPSNTYPIRRALLVPLYPTLIAFTLSLFYIYVFFSALSPILPGLLLIGFQLGLAGGGIMLSCWLRDGRPPFGPWSREFWMTRWVYRRRKIEEKNVWGPAGPMGKELWKGNGWDEEKSMGLQKPRNVRLGRGFRK